MPKLIRMYITQALIGFAISAVFVTGLLYLNVANLWHLVTHSTDGPLAVFLLFMFNGIVFSGVQFGVAIMRMTADDDDTGSKRQPEPLLNPSMIPVPVRHDDPRERRRR
ncbi:hypothetical protein [Vannielia sp.]|uniref:hypothetical protein n=1 Tax=Vannielia sp. TaxID=2813045 RepID=UPI00261AC900|nr:hypothetical protein [Vannielia sp.]MDF1873562.1 hypothetical protein [Vannielia sp.]